MFPLTEPYSPTMLIKGASGAAQTNAATLAATTGKLNYLTGFDITGGGATAASVIDVTITGLLGGTVVYSLAVEAGATAPVNAQGGLSVRFPHPVPASAVNTAIAVSVPTFGSGNTDASVVAHGFQI